MSDKIISLLLAGAMLGLCACAAQPASSAGTSPAAGAASAASVPAASAESSSAAAPGSKAQQLLDSMTPDEKIGQLFLIRPDALDDAQTDAQIDDAAAAGVLQLTDAMTAVLREYPAGGIVLFGKNLESPAQLTAFTAALQQASAVPLLLGIDEEGGRVSRIANSPGFTVKQYASMGAVGATGDPANAEEAGTTIGTYLAQYGLNLDFAPDADVNTNPDNIVIGDRSFGSDPQLVAQMAAAEITGLHSAGVMTSAKHFPGHGDTQGDTHAGAVSVQKTWSELQNCELIPFGAAIAAGTDLVMAAHITAPNVTSDGLPASLSKELITDKLRGELGFQGVVTTDAMSMGAITQAYTPGDAAVKAILAGADIVLMPEDYRAAFAGVRDAVNAGTISAQRLDESVLRILSLKERYGMLG